MNTSLICTSFSFLSSLPFIFLSLHFHLDTEVQPCRELAVLWLSTSLSCLTFLSLHCRISNTKAYPHDRQFHRLITILPLLDMLSTLLNSLKSHFCEEAKSFEAVSFPHFCSLLNHVSREQSLWQTVITAFPWDVLGCVQQAYQRHEACWLPLGNPHAIM